MMKNTVNWPQTCLSSDRLETVVDAKWVLSLGMSGMSYADLQKAYCCGDLEVLLGVIKDAKTGDVLDLVYPMLTGLEDFDEMIMRLKKSIEECLAGMSDDSYVGLGSLTRPLAFYERAPAWKRLYSRIRYGQKPLVLALSQWKIF
jgi:hypothetical protein